MSLGENLLLKNKAISTENYVSDLKKIVLNLKAINSNIQIFLFGSVATNTATTYSDIDLAIITNSIEQKKNIQKKFYELKRITDCSVDLVFLTIDQFKNDVEYPISQVIQNEGVELYPIWRLNHGQ